MRVDGLCHFGVKGGHDLRVNACSQLLSGMLLSQPQGAVDCRQAGLGPLVTACFGSPAAAHLRQHLHHRRLQAQVHQVLSHLYMEGGNASM